MRSLFNWRRRAPDPVTPDDLTRDDLTPAERDAARAKAERDIAEREAASRRVAGGGWRDAYDRGRRDERARKPGFSLVSAVVLMAAVIGGGAIFLAAREGSFTAGGEVVDHQLTTAADKAKAPLRGAADKAGDALENAGQNLKQKAGATDQGQQQADNQ
ncbi:hypothetical protein ACO2Q3_23505 [Caulobacter sp. KR2-114]|uniref:hypothetical protein n=1 Tax=Caulobacter sp. KR2-114 TaxID=3400912 RepID=UPI003BFB2A5F